MYFFRHFLHDARPEYTPEDMDRYIQAWSQPGAATGMINYYRSSVRTSSAWSAPPGADFLDLDERLAPLDHDVPAGDGKAPYVEGFRCWLR